jgi:hypothetical protein
MTQRAQLAFVIAGINPIGIMANKGRNPRKGERGNPFGNRYLELPLCHATIVSVIARQAQKNPVDLGDYLIQDSSYCILSELGSLKPFCEVVMKWAYPEYLDPCLLQAVT